VTTWNKNFLLSNNSSKVCEQKRVVVHELTYKYKLIQLAEKASVNLKKNCSTYNE